MIVLVCGGRDYYDRERVCTVLNQVLVDCGGNMVLVHGDARGADSLADQWAQDNGVDRIKYPANWMKHEKAAGPIRNRRMYKHAKPDLVVAFPGNVGTPDMISVAKKGGTPVKEIK